MIGWILFCSVFAFDVGFLVGLLFLKKSKQKEPVREVVSTRYEPTKKEKMVLDDLNMIMNFDGRMKDNE